MNCFPYETKLIFITLSLVIAGTHMNDNTMIPSVFRRVFVRRIANPSKRAGFHLAFTCRAHYSKTCIKRTLSGKSLLSV